MRRAALVGVALTAFLAVATPAASPRSGAAAAVFDLWTGRWRVTVRLDGRVTQEMTFSRALRGDPQASFLAPSFKSGAKVSLGIAPNIQVGGREAGLSLVNGRWIAPGNNLGQFRARIDPATFRDFQGTLLTGDGKQTAGTIVGRYLDGGNRLVQLRLGITPSRRTARPGDSYTLTVTARNDGPAAIAPRKALVLLLLPGTVASVDVLRQQRISCRQPAAGVSGTVQVYCELLALGPTRTKASFAVRATVPRPFRGTQLTATVSGNNTSGSPLLVNAPQRRAVLRIIGGTTSPPPPPPPPPAGPLPHLAGGWKGNDGATYNVVQSRGFASVTWLGTDANGTWTHNFSGEIKGRYLVGKLKDRPGDAQRIEGDLVLLISNPDLMTWVASLGSIRSVPTATRVWTRTRCPTTPPRPPPCP